jgi:hypothetical protein
MLRLMGLPHVARFPKATVTREEDCFQLLFRGEEHSRRVDVDLRYLDDAATWRPRSSGCSLACRNWGTRSSAALPLPPEGGAES